MVKERQYDYFRGANDFTKMNVHPSITIDQMPIVSLPIFQFDQLLQRIITSRYKSLSITQYLKAL
jgi:hypothetical protein